MNIIITILIGGITWFNCLTTFMLIHDDSRMNNVDQ